MIGIPSSAFATGEYYIEPLRFLAKCGEPTSNIRGPKGEIVAQVLREHEDKVLAVFTGVKK